MTEERLISDLSLVSNVEPTDIFPLTRDGGSKAGSALQIASYVIQLLTAGSPTALDTWLEIVARLEDDEDALAALVAGLATKQPLDGMLTALASLTSANGKFLAFTGADAPAARDIVGVTSQSGGVPTGAIIEKGSGANGEYTKFADGLMICRNNNVGTLAASTAAGALFSGGSALAWTFPQAFVDAPVGSACLVGTADNLRWVTVQNTNTAGLQIQNYRTTSSATAIQMGAMAVGRWF